MSSKLEQGASQTFGPCTVPPETVLNLTRFKCPPESSASSSKVLKIGSHTTQFASTAPQLPRLPGAKCASASLERQKRNLSKTGAYQRQTRCVAPLSVYACACGTDVQTETLGLAHLVLRILT